MNIGDSIKVHLPGETPWAEVVAVHDDGSWDGRIANRLFAEMTEFERRRILGEHFGNSNDTLPRLHDFHQDQVVRFHHGDEKFPDLWTPRTADRTAPAKEASAVTDEEVVARAIWMEVVQEEEPDERPDGWEDELPSHQATMRKAARAAISVIQSRRSSPVREDMGLATPKTASHPSPTSSAWRTMDGAPKDREIVCVDRNGTILNASWGDCCPGFPNSPNMRWCVTYSYGDHGYHTIDAVMWRDMPSPPEAESAATHEMGAERSGASPSLSSSEPSGRGESGEIQGPASDVVQNKGDQK